MNPSRVLSLLLVAALLTGCGTFQLASGIYPPPGKSSDQQQTDILVCKDQAKNEANTAGRQAGAFLLGMTLVGAPVAYELEKSKQREVFSECMTARGYRITPATDAPNNAKAVPPPVQQATPARETTVKPAAPVSEQKVAPAAPAAMPTVSANVAAPSRDDAAQLEKLKDLRDRGLITEEEYNAKRKVILDRL